MAASEDRCGDAACRRSTLLRRAASWCSVSRSRFDEIGSLCRFRASAYRAALRQPFLLRAGARLPSRHGRAGRRPGDGYNSCRLRAVGTGQTVRRRACRRTGSLTSSAVAWCACGCSRTSLPDSALVSSPDSSFSKSPVGSFIGLVSAARLRLARAACRVARGCRRAPNPHVGSGQYPTDFLGCVASSRHDARALHLLVQVASRRGGVLRRPPPISAPAALLEESHRRSSRTIRAVRRACGGDDTQRRGVVTVPMMNNSHGRPAAAVWSIRRLLGCLPIGCRLLAI